jgi:RNA-directed DNA polymerase
LKRYGDLFETIVAFDNLLAAARAAYKGKKGRPEPAAFHFHLESNLLRLQDELVSGSYQPGDYRSFWIYDPKERLISAAPYRDRVVHHAVCRLVEPLFDRTFIFDSYANRVGKGTHKALDRATGFCRRWPYVLKCDVAKFFPSVDHEVLLGLVARKIKCPSTQDLLARIVRSSNPQEPVVWYFDGDLPTTPNERRHGIPIGNLTSQFLANVMLDPLDHYVKEVLRWPGYLRFADDFLLFGDDKHALHELLPILRDFLASYRLQLHPRKCVVLPVRLGVPFLGWRLYPDHRRLRRATGVRFQRRLRELAGAYHRGEVALEQVRPSIMNWIGHLKHGDTWGLRSRLMEDTVFTRRP